MLDADQHDKTDDFYEENIFDFTKMPHIKPPHAVILSNSIGLMWSL